MTTGLAAVPFDVPLVNPAPNGLWSVVNWADEPGALRWLPSGVEFRVWNYGGEAGSGEWTPAWNVAEADLGAGDVKRGERPEFPGSFLATTTWAADDCDLRPPSQDEVKTRAQQTFRLQEPLVVEAKFAERLLADVGSTGSAADITRAVGQLEALLAKTNTLGVIHAGAQWAAVASTAQLIVRNGSVLKTPLGHTWAFGGSYVDGLGDTLVATSPVFGWRGTVHADAAPSYKYEEFLAVAERSLVVGYEQSIGAVEIT